MNRKYNQYCNDTDPWRFPLQIDEFKYMDDLVFTSSIEMLDAHFS